MLADLLPPNQMVIIDSYSESSYLADQVFADPPPQMAILEIHTLRAHIRQTRCWQIYSPQSNGDYRFLL